MQETQETWAQSLDREDSLEKEMAIHPVFLSGEFHGQRIPGGLQSMVSKRVGHNLETVVDSLEQLQKPNPCWESWTRQTYDTEHRPCQLLIPQGKVDLCDP